MDDQRWPEGDAFGQALLDHLRGARSRRIELEVDDGRVVPALSPEWFFRGVDDWDAWERELLCEIDDGPIVDLGAGAGRAALWLQARGLDVTAVDSSPLAARVCRLRGLRDVRVGDLNHPPTDRVWSGALLLGGNLGLGGSFLGTRRLLGVLANLCAPEAVLVGDTVDPRGAPAVRLRIRYGGVATRWWPQYNVPIAEVSNVVDGTGWALERHIVERPNHAVVLRREHQTSSQERRAASR